VLQDGPVETAVLTLVQLPALVVMVLGFGLVIRALLGVRMGVVRTLLAAALALWAAGPMLHAMLPHPESAAPLTALLFLVLSTCAASLLAMTVLVVAEVIVPEGSLPGPLEMWRGWRGRAARTGRYLQILRIAVKHGLGRFLRGYRHTGVDSSSSRRELARSVRRALDDGGVTFVKLGQQLSTRRDLLPAEFAEELSRLQDGAAPLPWPVVADVLAAEIGSSVDTVFSEVEPKPLASASVAQVHRARLHDGSDVVVKVQRPGIAAVVDRDLDILQRLARTLEGRTDWGRSLGVRELAGGFAEALREELDFTTERDNMRAVARAMNGSHRAVRVPAPRPELCTERVLVMERMTGTPLGAAEPLLATLGEEERRDLATALLDTMLEQVLVHGLFHVDVHPGNVMVAGDGSLQLLDFGSVGRLDATTRTVLGRLLAALGGADSQAACDALLELVDRPDQVDERRLERALGALLVRYTSPASRSGTAAFAGLFRLVTSHGLGVPPQVAAAFRAFATLEGTLMILDPGFDLVAQARASGRTRMAEAMRPGSLRQSVEQELVSLLPVLRRLPRRVDRMTDAVEHGRVTLNVRLLADGRDRRFLTGLLQQVLLTGLGAATGLMAVQLLAAEGGPQVTDSLGLFALLGYGLLIVAAVLALRVLVLLFRRHPT
jgi:ubiquinone biosynthesis protein